MHTHISRSSDVYADIHIHSSTQLQVSVCNSMYTDTCMCAYICVIYIYAQLEVDPGPDLCACKVSG